MKTLAIVPAYNEEMNIVRVIETIRECGPADLDIVVVNDGSQDRTAECARAARAVVLDCPINLGIGGAVQTGFRYAVQNGYDVAVQVDGDGQHDPAYLSALFRPIAEQRADVVIGSRFLERGGFRSTVLRRIGIAFFQALNSLILRQRITDNTSGFRAYGAPALRYLADHYPTDYPEPESVVMLGRAGFRIAEIPVVMRERQGGKSSITHLRSWYYMIKVTLAILMDTLRSPHPQENGHGRKH